MTRAEYVAEFLESVGVRQRRSSSDRTVPRRVVRPLERYLRTEFGSASLLMLAAGAALAWANTSPPSYARVWDTSLTVGVGGQQLSGDLRHFVNDLLMAVFFYVVAVEVKRELLFGSLRNRRSAAVPAAAALGTMVGAGLTYTAVNLVAGGDLRGWAIPIATDIAFAVGVLSLAGSRVPRELRAFMLTLAVVDDLGTIAVIAIFFSHGLSLAWLAASAGLVVAVVVAQRLGIRTLVPYVLLAGALWLAIYECGVHATIAGVLLGFLTPATAPRSRREVQSALEAGSVALVRSDDELAEELLLEVERVAAEGASPLARAEKHLHPWTAYTILPLFALANAGVPVSLGGIGDALSGPVGFGIALGLVVGAPLAGFVFAYVAARVGSAQLPPGLDWAAIAGAAPLKGIGFTIAIFICELAFDEDELRNQSKLAILLASAVAAVTGLVLIWMRDAARRAREAPA